MIVTRTMLFDLPEDHDLVEYQDLEYYGMLDIVYQGAIESHLNNDQSLLHESLTSYEEMFSDSDLTEDQMQERLDRMVNVIQRVVWSLKDYIDPIRKYAEYKRQRHISVTDVRVYLQSGAFSVILEIDDESDF